MCNDLLVTFGALSLSITVVFVFHQVYSVYQRLWSLEYDMKTVFGLIDILEKQINNLNSELASLKQVKEGESNAKTN